MSAPRATRLEDLARLAGVSIATASRALNDSPAVNARTKQRVWKLAREHDYPFRASMPAGPLGATGTIALVVPRPQGRDSQLDDPFTLELVAGIGDAARTRGYDLLVSHFAPSSSDELEAALATRADGVIFLGQSTLHPALNRLAGGGARFVVWGAELPDQGYASVGSDNVLGGRRAAAHLLRLGRRRILFLGDRDAPEVAQRLRGYQEALARARAPAAPELLVESHFTVESAQAATDALIAGGVSFDGVVAASDLIALGAARAIMGRGRRVPGDVSVVGYDDVPFARLASPALTTVRQDTAQAGRLLVSKLVDATGGEMRSERIPTELIVRASCGG